MSRGPAPTALTEIEQDIQFCRVLSIFLTEQISVQKNIFTISQNPIQQYDWANREYVELITTQIKKIADFLNSFDSR